MSSERTGAGGPRPRRGRPQPPPREARPAAGATPAETGGGALERRVARLEFAEGALARLRVPVPAEDADAGRDVLTDMDVLSVDVDLRLRTTRSSLECKSGRGQSGEPMTLVWLAGFRQLLDLDRVVLVRPSVSSRGRSLARRLSVAVLDEQTILTREQAHRWLPERFAHLDGEECTEAETRADRQLKGLPELPAALTRFLRHETLLADSPALLAAVHALGAAATRQGAALPEPTGAILAGHALMAVLMAGLQDARRLDEMSPSLLRGRLERALTTGHPDDTTLLPMLERADALVRHVVERTHRAYVAAGAEPLRTEVPSLRDTVAAAPDYLDDYLDLVTRLRSNPSIARDLLQTAELVCFDALLGGSAWRAEAFAHLFTPEHHGLLLVGLRCLARVSSRQVADHLQGLVGLDFRGGAGVPDRRRSDDQSATRTDAPQPSPAAPAGTPAADTPDAGTPVAGTPAPPRVPAAEGQHDDPEVPATTAAAAPLRPARDSQDEHGEQLPLGGD